MKNNLMMKIWLRLKKTKKAGKMRGQSILMKVTSSSPMKKTIALKPQTAKLLKPLSRKSLFVTRISIERIHIANLSNIIKLCLV